VGLKFSGISGGPLTKGIVSPTSVRHWWVKLRFRRSGRRKRLEETKRLVSGLTDRRRNAGGLVFVWERGKRVFVKEVSKTTRIFDGDFM